ncbi:MAG: dUTP diphosphatase [bacterium]
MSNFTIKLKKEAGFEDLPLPTYMTVHAAGLDLFAAILRDVIIQPGERKMISSGISIALPEGYEAQIRPRSGLALKHGITLVNTPGTIDADYRGIIGLIVINHGSIPYTIKRGDRIAQMIINKVIKADFEVVDELPETERGDGGFGHTSINIK